jgi:hypothetical protein
MTLSTHPYTQRSDRASTTSAHRVSRVTEAVVAAYVSDLAAASAAPAARSDQRPASASGSLRLRDGHAVRVATRGRRPASRARVSRGDASRRPLATA